MAQSYRASSRPKSTFTKPASRHRDSKIKGTTNTSWQQTAAERATRPNTSSQHSCHHSVSPRYRACRDHTTLKIAFLMVSLKRGQTGTLCFLCRSLTFHLNIRVHTPAPEPSCFSLCRAAAHRLHAVWWGGGVRVGRKSATCWSDPHTATTKIFPLKNGRAICMKVQGLKLPFYLRWEIILLDFLPVTPPAVCWCWLTDYYLNEVMFFYRAASGPVVLPFSLVVDVSVLFVQLSLLITKSITFFFPIHHSSLSLCKCTISIFNPIIFSFRNLLKNLTS